MVIDHIGYAVKNIERAKNSFEELGFHFDRIIDDTDRNVRIVFGQNSSYRVEIVAPMDRTKESPVDSYLKKTGPAPYHICYCSDNLESDIEVLRSKGFRTVIEPKEAIAFGGKKVVFMISLSLGLIELVEM